MDYTYSGNRRTKFTRMCIAEAIIELMQKEDLNHIKISAVTKKAGVSRKTFYNYFGSLHEVLTDYLQEIIAEYLEACNGKTELGSFLEYPHILFALKFFDQYTRYFLTLTSQGLHSILLNGINQFMIAEFSKNMRHTVYEMYCYSGGLLNTFLKWEESNKEQSPEEIAHIIYKLYNSKI